MSLTKEDLRAIKDIFEEGLEDLKRQTAAGFAEVHARIDRLEVRINRLEATVNRTNQILEAEIHRNDHQDMAITRIRKNLHAA